MGTQQRAHKSVDIKQVTSIYAKVYNEGFKFIISGKKNRTILLLIDEINYNGSFYVIVCS